VETRKVVRIRRYHPASKGGKPGADDQAEKNELEGAKAVA
jgi:hypothetical protein